MSLPGVERIYLANKSLEELRTLRKETKLLAEIAQHMFGSGVSCFAKESLTVLRRILKTLKMGVSFSCTDPTNKASLDELYKGANDFLEEKGSKALAMLKQWKQQFPPKGDTENMVGKTLSSQAGVHALLPKQAINPGDHRTIEISWKIPKAFRGANPSPNQTTTTSLHQTWELAKNLGADMAVTGGSGSLSTENGKVIILNVRTKTIITLTMPTEMNTLLEIMDVLRKQGLSIVVHSTLRQNTHSDAPMSELRKVEIRVKNSEILESKRMDAATTHLEKVNQLTRPEIDHVYMISAVTLHVQYSFDKLLSDHNCSNENILRVFTDAVGMGNSRTYQEVCASRQNQARAGIQCPIVLGVSMSQARPGFTDEAAPWGEGCWRITKTTARYPNIMNLDIAAMCRVFVAEHTRFTNLRSESEFLQAYFQLRAKLLYELIGRMVS